MRKIKMVPSLDTKFSSLEKSWYFISVYIKNTDSCEAARWACETYLKSCFPLPNSIVKPIQFSKWMSLGAQMTKQRYLQWYLSHLIVVRNQYLGSLGFQFHLLHGTKHISLHWEWQVESEIFNGVIKNPLQSTKS